MEYKQRIEITGELRGPFVLSRIPIALNRKITRKKYACAYAACRDLRAMAKTLSPATYYGADVVDDSGAIVAEIE